VPDWLTVKTFPAMVIVPLREAALELAEIE
jgi:hypothetical protein